VRPEENLERPPARRPLRVVRVERDDELSRAHGRVQVDVVPDADDDRVELLRRGQ
jgi:hypothetical protein